MEVGTAVAVADSLGVSHIAIIDDDVPIRQVLTEALTDEGLSVVVWNGPEEPLAFIERTQPAVIILDLRLSGWVSHWAIIDALRDGKGGLRIPIIVCTADTAFVREHRDELERLSCAVVEKPFDLDVLLREVHRCLALSVR